MNKMYRSMHLIVRISNHVLQPTVPFVGMLYFEREVDLL